MRGITACLVSIACCAAWFACGSKPETASSETLFRSLSPKETGVDFRNDLGFDPRFNIFTYRNYYNGGGVALGDVNGDGLLDIYVTANQGANKLYLNRGDFRFEDVTEAAGVAGNAAWATGVAMADVNGDGLLDIYVCNSGDVAGDNKKNELFINNGDGTFTEQAEAFGLADEGFSTHAVFFDFDGDGDLDVYLLNNSYQAIGSFNKMQNERVRRDPVGGDKLYRNDDGRFVDVSEEAGIFGSVIGFGLGITIGDVNRDGLMDIFISNDFFEKDYLYINQGDGTFSEELETYMRSISAASMGADIADINNDGFPDIFVTDMLPEPQTRLKQVTTFENWDKFQFNKTHDYHYQFNRNMLHLNNGDGTFSEIGRMTGMEATDWSWAALIADFDSDGLKDVFVANGIYQDITDLDYLNFIDNDETKRQIISKEAVDYKALIDPIPVNPISNYAFQNKGDLFFENVAASWGLATPNHANGAAYGDLNNDGYLDLVVNQVNGALAIYQNQTPQLHPEHHFLQVQLKGKGMNTAAVGAQIQVLTASGQKYLEQMPNRGFQSSVDPKLTIGLGPDSLIQRLTVRWPDGTFTVKEQVRANQLLTLEQEEAEEAVPTGFFPAAHAPAFALAERPSFTHTHEENRLVDFDRERLLYHKRSTEGPAFAQTELGEVSLYYVGGAKGFAGTLYRIEASGESKPVVVPDFLEDAGSEDAYAVFFDANGDGYPDLYVSSGGNDSGFGDPSYLDRLYLSDGAGNFLRAQGALPNLRTSSSVVLPVDLTGNGHLDLIVGGRLVPFAYGVPAATKVLINDGKGKFRDETAARAPGFEQLGLVTTGVLTEVNGQQAVLLAGEWMAPQLYLIQEGKLKLDERQPFADWSGWYYTASQADLTGNGRMDIVLGGQGLNSRLKPSTERPLVMVVNDFDQNGSVEQVFTYKEVDRHMPITLKHELERQLPYLKKRYLKYSAYNNQYLEDIFEPALLEKSLYKEVQSFASIVLLQGEDGIFRVQPLPREAQKSRIFSVLIADFNADGIPDLLLGGNLYGVKPEMGKYDASFGELFLGKGDGGFDFVPNRVHGLQLEGDVRHLHWLPGDKRQLLVLRNQAPTQVWEQVSKVERGEP